MTIYTAIKNIAESITDNFHYGRNMDINIQADDKAFPAIVMIEPDTIGFMANASAGTIKKTATVFMRFLDILPNIAEQAEYRLETIDNMTLLAGQFVRKAMESEYITIIAPSNGTDYQISGIAVIEAYDANLHGIEIQLNVSLVQPEDIC